MCLWGLPRQKNFHDILQTYEDLADQYGLWDAVSVIKEYGCSDDGFIDFRAWLIAQGKEVYMNALRDPDTLADIEPYGDCCFECLSYVGDYAYEQLTGRSAYDEMEPDRIEKMRDELKKDNRLQRRHPIPQGAEGPATVPTPAVRKIRRAGAFPGGAIHMELRPP